MDGAAPLARTDLEDRRVAVGAVCVPGQLDVRALGRQAGERAFGGPQEQVVARRERRGAVGSAQGTAELDHRGQAGTGLGVVPEQDAGDLVEGLRPSGERSAQGGQRLLVQQGPGSGPVLGGPGVQPAALAASSTAASRSGCATSA